MPMLIEHIDAIARQKQRDALYIKFVPENCAIDDGIDTWLEHDYRNQPRRAEVLSWFDAHNIPWQICGLVANENIIECPYFGDVYIDIPFDENDPQYQIVRDYLENPDGTMRDKDALQNNLNILYNQYTMSACKLHWSKSKSGMLCYFLF